MTSDPHLDSQRRPQRGAVASLTSPQPLFTPGQPTPAPPDFNAPPLGSIFDDPPARTPARPAFATPSVATTPAGHSFTPAPGYTPAPLSAAPLSAAPLAATPAGGFAAAAGEHWVTAFGYSSAAMITQVLEELRPSSGARLRHTLGLGLWLHVCYAERHHLEEALSKNGRVLSGCMLGVIEGIVPAGSLDESRGGHLASGMGKSLPLRFQASHGDSYALQSAALQRSGRRSLPEGTVSKAFNSLCEMVLGW